MLITDLIIDLSDLRDDLKNGLIAQTEYHRLANARRARFMAEEKAQWEAQNKEADQIVNKKYARKTTVSEKPGKEVYYFTFGQDHVHPRGGYPMKDYWVEAEGDWTEARTKMFAKYGDKWSMQYAAEDFEPELFPKGCHEKL